MASITDSLTRLGDLSVPFTPVSVTGLGDAELLASQGRIAEVRRRLDAVAATVAGEIAHRSRRELGHAGLAQSEGVRTAEVLIAKVSGTSTREARTLVKAAELLPVERPPAPDAAPVPRWQRLIGDAVAVATISVEAAELIRTRLTAAADGVDEDALANAAERLLAEAAGLTIEQLAIRAGRVRDELDLAGVAAREQELRAKRFLRVSPQLDGMTRVTGLLDPESAAIVVPILDAATSPRRGGPRFVNPNAIERAEDIMRDARTTEQLALDTLVDLVRAGAQVDPNRLLGDRKPAVRILVTKTDLDTRVGAAFFEGQTEAVSIDTAERFICSTGAIPILFDDDGRALNLGREHRLFTEKQRVAMAARDGGCLMCGRPPSWCEAHHIDHWDEHAGRTDIDSGVLLCRFCHLTVHNNRWRIRRDGGDYLLEKPDPNGVLRHTPLPSRSPPLSRLLAG
ncbi:HNH endonuclease signature motif containing protein [Protaetiibacter mangrovi]|uniref:HNH endonuclease n=1 Tax=Protaetiibacter mangrovi TaxID=2970926 RepID=A0ABT1ZGT4_9MICO|nr:HNH endonuclease signature motif containing protein [Protaetiibacter mangrovi]MCS0499895.1 HNH endonuclease [Protaetiibacter mangrovi]